MLKSKLHQARVTQADLNYEGSFSIDAEIMEACNIIANEQIHVCNITNGQRYITYAIPAPPGSRIMCANGACARLTAVGDRVIICTYVQINENQLEAFKPTIALLNENNDFKLSSQSIDSLAKAAAI
ncbi:MAG: aspartate 1-decarboxylase [Pseudomonadota bacterium]